MLGLKLATDPYWVNIAEKTIDEILIDHAYCEQKAASTCISLIVKYPHKTELVEEITPIDDVRGTANYRRQLTRNVFLKFYHQTQADLAPA